MTIYGSILPGAASIARSSKDLSPKARGKLKVLDWLRTHEGNISLAARHFGLARETVILWRERLRSEGLQGLEDRSRKPKRFREPGTKAEIVSEVVKIRKEYPAWSKYKIQPLLPKHLKTSESTVGRILKRKGLIDKRISRKRSKAAKHPRARYPRGMKISKPGDMIQIDTKHIMLPGGNKHYQFTAIDVLTKLRVLQVYASESSRNGAVFLDECRREFPFPISATQSDNGAPFQKDFEKRCKDLELPHFFTYPRHPKQNCYVESSHSADEREFYQQGNAYQNIQMMRIRIKEWQNIWNSKRPHQALNYLTPNQYLEKYREGRIPTKDIITLQT